MDPQTDLPDLVEDLEVNIDELTTTLQPLLSTPLHTTASSLPLLDKAKLYVLAAYSIESLLFSTLKASGVNATEHPVFKEIARLKGYFGKIKEVEERGPKSRSKLDVGAAQRFIKHGLAGNDKYDLERKERMAKEKARAHLKAQQINKKFDDEGKEVESEGATPKKRAMDQVDDVDEDMNEDILEGLEEAEPATKKARVASAEAMDVDSEAAASSSSLTKKDKKTKKPKGKKTVKTQASEAKQSTSNTDTSDQDQPTPLSVTADTTSQQPDSASSSPPPQPKKRGRPRKNQKKDAAGETAPDSQPEATPSRQEERVTRKRNKRLSNQNTQNEASEEPVVPTPDRAPKTRSETFNALLDGSLSEKQKKGKATGARGKGKGKARGK
jgi:exosome complex protein LRP1